MDKMQSFVLVNFMIFHVLKRQWGVVGNFDIPRSTIVEKLCNEEEI